MTEEISGDVTEETFVNPAPFGFTLAFGSFLSAYKQTAKMLFHKVGKNDLSFQIGRSRQKEELNKSSKAQSKCMLVPRREFWFPVCYFSQDFLRYLPQLNTKPDQK